MTDAQDVDEHEELLQFLYLMPVGIVKFAPDGAVGLLNPMASQLLLPLLPEPRLDNLYTALRHLMPELPERIAAHGEAPGTVIELRQVEGKSGAQRLVLGLTITRVNARCCMAVIKDITRLIEMLGFAFTGADLLLDIDTSGRINWAAGAFKALLDTDPRDMVGRPVAEIVAPGDREALRRSLAAIGTRGRLRPLAMRLGNAAETPISVAGMAAGEPGGRVYMTVGQVPEALPQPPALPQAPRDFAREAAGWARSGKAGAIGLLEVSGWSATAARMDAHLLGCLRREIGHLATQLGGDTAVLGELGGGRFGVLGPAAIDLGRLGAAMGELIGDFAEGQGARVEAMPIALGTPGLDGAQSVQALRLLLARFAARGAASVPPGGLAGMLETARSHRAALADVIARGRFRLLYQPVVLLADRSVHHHEALVRPEPDLGIPATTPQEFATLAEALGLAAALDRAVLERAATAIRGAGLTVAVNVSALSIAEAQYVDPALAQAASLPPGRLMLELTETAEIDDLARVGRAIDRMRAAGMPVCLDDFGAGSTSLQQLRALHVDYVKIDGTYVRAAEADEQGRAFVMAMHELATSCGAATIAEMVETEPEAALMQALGIGFGQGWLFGRPGPLPGKAQASQPVRRWRY